MFCGQPWSVKVKTYLGMAAFRSRTSIAGCPPYGLMSGDGKRGTAAAPVLDSTDQGPQTPCRNRYRRQCAGGHRARSRHSRPRWCPMVIESVRQTYPSLVKLFADGGYAGEKLSAAIAHIEGLAIEIVKRADAAKGLVVLPKRWVVERTSACLNRCRRLAKDWESTIASSEAWLLLASIRRMVRAVARA